MTNPPTPTPQSRTLPAQVGAPRRISETPPVFPCWLWLSCPWEPMVPPCWLPFSKMPVGGLDKDKVTHWLPDQPTAPTCVPDALPPSPQAALEVREAVERAIARHMEEAPVQAASFRAVRYEQILADKLLEAIAPLLAAPVATDTARLEGRKHLTAELMRMLHKADCYTRKLVNDPMSPLHEGDFRHALEALAIYGDPEQLKLHHGWIAGATDACERAQQNALRPTPHPSNGEETMTTPNNDSPATQPWAEAAAREIAMKALNAMRDIAKQGRIAWPNETRHKETLSDWEAGIARTILKFAPPKQDVSREISVCDTACMDAAALRTRLTALEAALPGVQAALQRVHDRTQTYLVGRDPMQEEYQELQRDFEVVEAALSTLRAFLPTTPPTEGKE